MGSDVLVKVKITNGTAGSRQVFWTCTQGPCHTGCGFKSIGVITIGSDGKGKFKFKGAAPFAGKIHFDICPGTVTCSGGNYYSGEFAAPSDELVEASEDAKEGDATLQ